MPQTSKGPRSCSIRCVDRGNLAAGQQSAADPGLVAEDTGGDAAPAQPLQRLPCLGHRLHQGRIAVVRDIADEGAVPVEQDGPQRDSGSFHTSLVPRTPAG